ncbi:unnamed protein product [Victoria cruziana]
MSRNSLPLNKLKTMMWGCPQHSLKTTVLVGNHHQSANSLESADPTERVCKIMLSSPKLILEKVLDESGIRPSPDVVEKVIERLETAGMLVYGFFRWAEKQRSYTHTVRAYNLVIDSLAKIKQYQLMWGLVSDMRRKNLLNIETFSVMMRRYARAQKVDEAIYTFNIMDKFGVTPNLAAFNSLLGAFCKSKNVRKAQEIFDSMKSRFVPDSKTYSVLLEGWGREPNLLKAREVYREMVENGCEPDIVTYSIMVDILCKTGRMEEAVEVMAEMRSRNCMPNSFIYSVLVHQYGSEKRIGDAVEMFLEMEKNGIGADVAVYNALVGAFCKVRKFKNVFRVLQEMEYKGVSPNSRTFNTILISLIDARECDEAVRVFRRMTKLCDPDSDTYAMMIKLFCDMDKLEMALKIWKYMGLKQFIPSMHTFSVLINGLCGKGELDKACILLEEMIEKGIRPSGPTVQRLRKLLLKEGREDVLEFLMEKIKLLINEPLND